MIERIAGIDIGTNTILMLIADYQNKRLKRICENFAVARLGENLDKTSVINEDAISRACEILIKNREICTKNNVKNIIAVGTSALRDAENSQYVLSKLNESISSEIKVISGEQEAALSFLGTVSSPEPALVIDIGGGSTELIIGEGDKINSKISLQAGAVRVTERFLKSKHPPDWDDIERAEASLKEMLNNSEMKADFKRVYAVAGTATTLATTALGLSDNEVDRANGYILSATDLQRIFDMYLNSGVDEIIHKYKVHPRRADLILAGALIMKSVVNHFKIEEVIISSKGLRYGILMDYFKKYRIV